MRISTQAFFERSAAGMSSLQQELFTTQQKIAAGRKFLAPSGDPVAASRALGVSQSIAQSSEYASTRDRTRQTLSLEDSALQHGADILQHVKSLIVQAGNGTLTDADRGSIAKSLQADFSQLLGVANSDDGNGQYLFAGYRSETIPFQQQPPAGNVQYQGDTGQRLMQVDVARQMAATDDGRSVFQSVQGNATPVTTAGAANGGTGVFSNVSVNDGKSYTVTFGAAGSYSIVASDGSTSPPLGPFTAGDTLGFGGLSMKLDGTPAAGDVFTVTQAPAASPDVFSAISDVVKALSAPVATAVDQSRLANALSTANVRVTNSHDNLVTVRASVGSRLGELDALGASADSRNVVDQKYLSGLQDLDYASAISEFAQRQTNLQATQQTFARLQGIALFNYL